MQRALLNIHFIMLLEELTCSKYLRIRQNLRFKSSYKIISPVKRSRIRLLDLKAVRNYKFDSCPMLYFDASNDENTHLDYHILIGHMCIFIVKHS